MLDREDLQALRKKVEQQLMREKQPAGTGPNKPWYGSAPPIRAEEVLQLLNAHDCLLEKVPPDETAQVAHTRKQVLTRAYTANLGQLEAMLIAFDHWTVHQRAPSGQEVARLIQLADELAYLGEKIEAQWSDESVARWLRTYADAIPSSPHIDDPDAQLLRDAAAILEDPSS